MNDQGFCFYLSAHNVAETVIDSRVKSRRGSFRLCLQYDLKYMEQRQSVEGKTVETLL